MYYYKSGEFLYVNASPIEGLQEISEEEYNATLLSLQPTEEEIRKQKEAQLSQLMRELYPDEYREE